MSTLDASTEGALLTRVSGPDLMDSTAAISRWVRSAGEPDELASFRWIEERMREYGYRTSLTHHPAFISLPGVAEVRLPGAEVTMVGISHAFARQTEPGGLSARLVDANAVVAGDGDDVDGAIVLIDGMANGGTVGVWEGRGAAGQIYVHDEHLHETSVSPVWGNPTDVTLASMPTTPSLAVRRSDGALLRAALVAGPADVVVTTRVLTEWRPIPLLLAELEDAPRTPFLLLSSHVDSWHYGAMDNASANAAAIEVSRLVAPIARDLARGLRVAFWSGHSHGRFAGSAWFADEHWHELHDDCIGHVFIDSVGGTGAIVVNEPPVMPQTSEFAAEVLFAVTGEPFEGKPIGRFADQSFYGIGLNCLFATLSEQDGTLGDDHITFRSGGRRSGGLGWWWHTPEDTIDKIDEANLVRDTQIYLSGVYRLLSASRLPFDYRPAVDEILAAVLPRVEAAREHLDLTALAGDLLDLREAVSTMHAQISEWGADRDVRVNEVLLKLSRHLVPVAYHGHSRFDRDPAEPLVPVPSLEDLVRLAGLSTADEHARGMASRLRRTSNWVRAEVRAATALARGLLVEGVVG